MGRMLRPGLVGIARRSGRGGRPFIDLGLKCLAASVVTLLFVPLMAHSAAEEGEAEPGTSLPALSVLGKSAQGQEPGPGLDALLQIPSGYLAPEGRTVGGAGESEWRRRFAQAHEQLERAQTALAETKQALDRAADGGGSSQWAVAPPGASNAGGPTSSPLSFKLRQELLRQREALDAAERSLRDLRIEADLVGVPVDWRGDRDTPMPKRLPDSPYYN